ncbi:hypothetical protein [Thalassotalea sp. SU-HH00458]|uniref:hypothetical protein n=1 Tax=Thalassotalea sp. SU-HH00458 TaxID=3127657 RepID=UPI003106612D
MTKISSSSNSISQHQKKNNNTTTHADPSVRTITSKPTYLESVYKYLTTTSKLLTIPEVKRLQYQFEKPRCFYSIMESWFRLQSYDESLSNEELRFLEDYLQAVLENPVHTGFLPFCDALAFTIDVNEKQLQKLHKAFLNFNHKDFKQTKKCRLVREDLPDSPEFFTFYSKFSFGKDKHIYVFWGLSDKVRKQRPDHRRLKISFNPARFNRDELITFFDWLKSCKLFNYRKLMRSANVTRVDVAADIIGVHVKDILADKEKVLFFDYYPKEDDLSLRVQTQEIGNPERSKSLLYDKVFKLLGLGNPDITLPVFKNSYVPIARYERRIKLRDFKALSLSKLQDCPYFLDQTTMYSPSILRQLTPEQRNSIERYGFTYWLNILLGEKPKQQNKVYELIQSNELNIAHEELQLLQKYMLKKLSELIIDRYA